MGIGKRIKEAREAAGLTQKELAIKIGVTTSAITNYETEISHPKESVMYSLMNALNIEPNFLFQDCVDVSSSEPMHLSFDESKHIEKYRALDVRGKETVNEVLDVQYRFSKQSGEEAQGAENDSKKNNDVNLCDENNVDVDMSEELAYFVVPFYSMPVSAGTGAFSEFECPEDMLLKKRPPRGTSFVVPVSGDSMEPDYYDGDKVFVHSQLEIEPGQTGVFLMDGQQWIKQLGEGDLISRNPAYPPRPMTDDVRCQGLVLGICDESYIKE